MFSLITNQFFVQHTKKLNKISIESKLIESKSIESKTNHMNQNIVGFQELVRVIDATIYKVDPESVNTGISTMRQIMNLIQCNGIRQAIGDEFNNFILQQNQSASMDANNYKPNVREFVKKILMYPAQGYEPWTEVYVNDDEMNKFMELAQDLQFTITIIDGKVYAVCDTMDTVDYREQFLTILRDHYQTISGSDKSKLVVNPESQHITVINSNICSDIGIDHVADFVNEFNKDNESLKIKFGKIKTTVSNDWPLFSRCYCIGIESKELNDFITKFNQRFKDCLKKPVSVSLHTTIAVVPRTLGLF